MFRGCPPLPFLFGGCLPFPIPFLQVVREERALLIRGYPPPPARGRRALPFAGDSLRFLCLAPHAGGGGRAACSIPLSLYPSCWCLLSLWYPRGCPCSPGAPRRLGCRPDFPVPVSRTHGVRARRAHWNAFAYSLPSLPSVTPFAVPCGALGGTTGSCPLDIFFPRLVAVFPLVSRVAGEFPSPPGPHPSISGTLSPSRVTSEVSPPRSNSSTPGLLVTLDDLIPPPPTPWKSPPEFSATPEALDPPSFSPTLKELSAGISCQPLTLSH